MSRRYDGRKGPYYHTLSHTTLIQNLHKIKRYKALRQREEEVRRRLWHPHTTPIPPTKDVITTLMTLKCLGGARVKVAFAHETRSHHISSVLMTCYSQTSRMRTHHRALVCVCLPLPMVVFVSASVLRGLVSVCFLTLSLSWSVSLGRPLSLCMSLSLSMAM